jgi:hypothetical protein
VDNIVIEESNQTIYHEFASEIIQDFFLNDSTKQMNLILYAYLMLGPEGVLYNVIGYAKEFITRIFFLEVIEIFENIPNGILKKTKIDDELKFKTIEDLDNQPNNRKKKTKNNDDSSRSAIIFSITEENEKKILLRKLCLCDMPGSEGADTKDSGILYLRLFYI